MAEQPTPVDIDALHAASEIRQVALSDLKVDRSYQRDPTQTLVDKIANNWDEVSSELLLISDRGERPDNEGGLFIVNGQHRSLGARKHGEEYVWARVLDLQEFEDPGAIESTFRLRTNVRMSDKPLERFRAQVRAGDEESIAIVAILDKFDTEVNMTPTTEAGINAVAVLERIYRVDNTGGLLSEVLQLHREVYGVVGGKTTSAAGMISFAWFILKHGEEADRGRAVEKWNALGHAALDRRGRTLQSGMGGTLWLNYYRALVDFYNERLQEKSKLDWRTKGASGFKGSTNWGQAST